MAVKSFVDAVAFGVHDPLHTIGQLAAQAIDVTVGVDVPCDGSQARTKLSRSFFPRLVRSASGLARADPRNSCLVQHHLLQIPWLH